MTSLVRSSVPPRRSVLGLPVHVACIPQFLGRLLRCDVPLCLRKELEPDARIKAVSQYTWSARDGVHDLPYKKLLDRARAEEGRIESQV
jgi:hypothetical protein